jgi:hypothetical protein
MSKFRLAKTFSARLVMRGAAIAVMCHSVCDTSPSQVRQSTRQVQTPSQPAVTLSVAGPQAVALANSCERGRLALTLRVSVTNNGTVATAAMPSSKALLATDQSRPAWAGRAALPAIAPHASTSVFIPVLTMSNLAGMAGIHQFTIRAKAFQAVTQSPIVVNIPSGFCSATMSRRVPAMTLLNNAQAKGRIHAVRLPERTSGVPPMSVPTMLQNTVNEQVCTQHGGFGGGLACKAALPQGWLVLVWNWNGPVVDGYRVYRVDGGQRTAVGTQQNGRDVTLQILSSPPAGGYAGKCYAVTAFKGSEESAPSDPFCVGMGGVVQTATFSPQHVRHIEREVGKFSGLLGGNYDITTDDGTFSVGFNDTTDPTYSSDGNENRINRLALWFDVSALNGHNVRSAKLVLTVDTTTLSPDYHTDHFTSCVAQIAQGIDYWWNYGDWINAAVVLKPGEYMGPNVAYDVTPIVQGWAGVTPNFGLVLLGNQENPAVFLSDSCYTTYVPSSPYLVVEVL